MRPLTDEEKALISSLEPCEVIDMLTGLLRLFFESADREVLIPIAIDLATKTMTEEPDVLQRFFGGPFKQDWRNN